ncbi:NAD-dependent epimerase dehydratase [Lentilactobacillus senioris DSM 24302 = JCM 17472]|uniref:NAD-dependent epimerase dehydratase n=1 Tax=Lentilactobacillus senioris DSM 24302 = JCM 17472 TaxID=1423802 RepID=A0A0R2CP11_9LACO|nr:NAD(P)H-binding protein [Lentilactobacillus senioris]KRM93320.1 NAD-dependent epimerase dehydratase [Lentilactobacillus senioris DSM 24302 = JCM 17472]MCY9806399.1 NAD(P)H-binding protein [Lentilactobacillus senioris]
MTNVLVLGATGRIAQQAEPMLLDEGVNLTLMLRNPNKLNLTSEQQKRANIIVGDVLDQATLTDAMQGVDIVYANLAGDVIEMAKLIEQTMRTVGVKRIVWISTLGIYDEVPGNFGKWNNETLGDYLTHYAEAAKVFEDSDLDYTIIRPAWLTDKDEVDYEVTGRTEAFKGTEVSRKSIAAVVTAIVQNPQKYERASIGVNKPNTDGDKPAFM